MTRRLSPGDRTQLRRAARRVAIARLTRDQLIRDRHSDGISLREIADATGELTHTGILKIIRRPTITELDPPGTNE